MAKILWYGGIDKGQDVTVFLVSAENDGTDNAKAVLKLHSSLLSKSSKYFETALSERWMKPDTNDSIEFSLEVRTDIDYYKDCFSRMYSRRPEDFPNVEYCLELLKVASQIDVHEIMDPILEFLSAVRWSVADENMIRDFSCSQYYPSDRAMELSSRLGLNMTKKDCHQRLRDLLQNIVGARTNRKAGIESLRDFLTAILEGVGSRTSLELARNVVTIVSTEMKDILVKFKKEFEEDNTVRRTFIKRPTLGALSMMLDIFLKFGVAKELVQYIAQDEKLSAIVASLDEIQSVWLEITYGEVVDTIVRALEEVVAGRLLLNISERLALLKNWQAAFLSFRIPDLRQRAKIAASDLLMTLPLEYQIECLRARNEEANLELCTTDALVMIVQRSWAIKELEPPASHYLLLELSTQEGLEEEAEGVGNALLSAPMAACQLQES